MSKATELADKLEKEARINPRFFVADERKEAAAELRRLDRVNSEREKDAERYRWLRRALSDRGPNGKSHWLCSISEGNPQELDKAIDTARAALKEATES